LTVGQNKQFSTISAAISASRDGDVVAIDAGTYVNDFANINTRITLQGVGGLAKLVATEEPSNGKGILVTNTDITIDRLEFSGAAVADGNGAGIRYQAGHLTITNSVFRDNQNGLLSNPNPGGSITIRGSEFAFNGTGDGYTHNLYVNTIGTLDIADSSFRDASVGHQIKSRALVTTITGSRISEGEGGNGAYSVDLPNGGRAVLTGNFIEQGAASGNPAIIAFGEEGNLHAGSSIEMTGNTIVNGLDSPSARLLLNESGTTAELHGNQVFGLSAGQYGSGSVNVSGMIVLGSKPGSAPSAEVAMPRPAAVATVLPQPVVESSEDVAAAAWDEASERPETEAEPEPEDWERAIEIATSTSEEWWEDAGRQDYDEYGNLQAANEEQDAADAAAFEFMADHWAGHADWTEEANHFDDFAFA
jgi:hypothetical protein